MTTQIQGATFRYSHTIGRGEEAGTGFKNPVAVARGEGDLMYVVSRSYDYRADAKRITICTVGEDYIGEIGNAGRLGGDMMDPGESAAPGSLIWPTCIALDREGNVYVTDEWLNRIAIFTGDGDWIGAWGTLGSGDGEIDRPSGIAFDAEDNLYVVDTGNNRIQKFTKDGQFLSKWGQEGSGDGQVNLPWGIDIDRNGDIYVADWRNDRIQKFTPDGRFLMKVGASGTGNGEFNRPTDVAVDNEGLIYVADWNNDRLQVFDADGSFITKLTGDATLSKWGETKLDANPDMRRQREVAQGLEREKFFRGPIGVEVDDQGQIFVVDSGRNRIQIYRKIPPYFLGLYDGGRL
ncbi:MAG TPA: 6-bladed beta-propeller [Dehalococcoidia bacterium]|nr:6-bladed beta-propeller [Dehalococcoidia bacterium]